MLELCIYSIISFYSLSKIVELEEELRVVGNNLKSLEVSEEKVSIRGVYSLHFSRQRFNCNCFKS